MFCITGVAADEHPACMNLPLNEPGYTRGELLTIAHSCTTPGVAELYFNRAQHIRLIGKYSDFEKSLYHYGNRDNQSYVESYRMQIALVEAFYTEDLKNEKRNQTLARLNKIYEQSNEIAELRFRGYDLIADRLEQNYQL
jgi:hypothetical protein